MSELESYEAPTVDRGYHVYVAAWEAAVGQTLPCKREGGNIHNSYVVAVVENNDTPTDNHTLHSMKIFAVKTFANCPETTKFTKVFTREKFPLYGIHY